MKFDQNLCKNFDMTKEVSLVSRTQPSGPLCLWQCLFVCFANSGAKKGGSAGKGGETEQGGETPPRTQTSSPGPRGSPGHSDGQVGNQGACYQVGQDGSQAVSVISCAERHSTFHCV